MRQPHKLGDKVFVDFAGRTIPVICRVTGEVRAASLFVAVLGASNFTYVEATWGQDLPSWIGAHTRMLRYFGGSPKVVVPDNLKSGVTKPCFYDPEINPVYQDWADHYKMAVLPARVRRPRDKAKVEQGVLLAQRWIAAVLRKRTFYDLAALNQAILELCNDLNQRPFKKLKGSRASVFFDLERATLGPLPDEQFVFAHRKKARVYLDYHIEVDGRYYSVPYRLVKAEVDVRYSAQLVEVFHRGQRVASHPRSYTQLFVTLAEHMPPQHRWRAQWTPERFRAWAGQVGPATETCITAILKSRPHPEQAYRACLGVLKHLGTKFGQTRLEAACHRATSVGANSYKSLASILERGLDKQPLPAQALTPMTAGHHENVRGPAYYS